MHFNPTAHDDDCLNLFNEVAEMLLVLSDQYQLNWNLLAVYRSCFIFVGLFARSSTRSILFSSHSRIGLHGKVIKLCAPTTKYSELSRRS